MESRINLKRVQAEFNKLAMPVPITEAIKEYAAETASIAARPKMVDVLVSAKDPVEKAVVPLLSQNAEAKTPDDRKKDRIARLERKLAKLKIETPEEAKKQRVQREFGKLDKTAGAQHVLLHLSEKNHDGETFSPRIPDNKMTRDGREESKTPRISFSKSIIGALNGIGDDASKKKYYIHEPADYNAAKVKEITSKEVVDQPDTEEVWVTDDVKLKTTGRIKVKRKGHKSEPVPGTDRSRTVFKYKKLR